MHVPIALESVWFIVSIRIVYINKASSYDANNRTFNINLLADKPGYYEPKLPDNSQPLAAKKPLYMKQDDDDRAGQIVQEQVLPPKHDSNDDAVKVRTTCVLYGCSRYLLFASAYTVCTKHHRSKIVCFFCRTHVVVSKSILVLIS